MNNRINWLILILVEGRNGGGDLWRTDGRLGAVVLKN